jgi:hypothetical protein
MPAAAKSKLYPKLLEVAEVIDNIEKKGRNDHHKYDYVQESDVKRAIRKELLNRKILVVPSTIPGSVKHEPAIGGKGFVTTVDQEYRFIDTETAEEFVTTWTGAGSDVGGDKGLYKAYTGSLKYLLLTLFLIPTGDDPEGDATSERPAQASASKDDARPAAPEIPLDRAKLILEQAVAAGLAEMGGEGAAFTVQLKPVLKAKLAAVGVNTGKIAHLNVDQAEDVEAFLTVEASDGNS